MQAMPAHCPETCRFVARVVDKLGHVPVDHVTYSVPIPHAYRPAPVKLYPFVLAISTATGGC